MTTQNYTLIIIDSENSLSPANLLDLIAQSKKKGVPIVISNLQTKSDDKTRSKNAAGNSSRKGFTLHRKWSEPTEKKDLHLVTETAATLCHEINNPLMAITANIEVLLKSNTDLPNKIIRKVRLIGRAADRIKVATRKLTRLDSLNYKETVAGRMINLDDSTDSRKTKLSKIGCES